ncbi:MAG: Uma2 family endonuclease [Verrucomicrobiota bacterium]
MSSEPVLDYNPHEYFYPEAYLRLEEESATRNEYVCGQVYAMAGASRKHEIISGNLFAALHSHLKGKPCEPFKSDVKLHTIESDGEIFYYPDIIVTCDPEDDHPIYVEKPVLLVEVASNYRRDFLEKFHVYTKLHSLKEYLILDFDQPKGYLHRREEDWNQIKLDHRDEIELRSVGLTVPLSDLYPA